MARIVRRRDSPFAGDGDVEYMAIGEPQTVQRPGGDPKTRMPTALVQYRPEREEAIHGPDARYSPEMIEHTPGMITGAYAHPDMAKHIPTLLGIATNHHRRLAGNSTALPLPDGSLSSDSSAMVQNLRSSGVPVPVNKDNPEAHPNNSHGHAMYVDKQQLLLNNTYSTSEVESQRVQDLSPAERQAGFSTVKNLLRAGRRAQTNPTQFGSATGEQLRLF